MAHDLLLFGEALVDQFASGPVVGGAPLNVARHLAGLGLKPLLLTRLGRDTAAERILDEMARFGLDRAGVQQDAEHASGTVRVHQDDHGAHRFEILPHAAYDFIEAGPALLAAASSAQAMLYFGSLAQRSGASRAALQALRTGRKAADYLDLNWREAQVEIEVAKTALESAQILKLNDEELAMAMGWYGLRGVMPIRPAQAGSRHAQISALMQKGSARLLILTCGASGHAAFDRDGRCLATGPAAPVPQLCDTVGAGDAFSAIVLIGLIHGWPLETTLARAGLFAAAICGVKGAAPGTLDFYLPWRSAWDLTPRQRLSPATHHRNSR